MRIAQAIEISNTVHDGLKAFLQDKTGAQLMCKPRGLCHKYTVYIGNSVIGTVSISPEEFIWRSKNKGMNKVLKRIAKEYYGNRGGDRVSSGIA